MAFPTGVSSFNDPTASNKLNSPSHSQLHQDVNTDLEAVETKLGTGSSTAADRRVLVGTGSNASAWEATPDNLTLDTPTLNTPDLNGTELILDADADTSITADTDDQIDIRINGADDFRVVANIFRALAGSSIEADTINDTSGSGVAVEGVTFLNGTITTANSLPDGAVVQVVTAKSTAVATGTTIIPYDDTIPQNTEGDQYMTLAITPRSTTNILVIEAVVHMANSAASQRFIAALFQDTTANALAVGNTTEVTANVIDPVTVFHSMVAGTTSSTTFKIRAGANAAGTTTFNGDSGVRKFGGITFSYMKITEYKAS
jgi:hypothetical protein